MAVDIREIRADHFALYTAVPIRFLFEKDLAVLWDLRMHPDRRGQGIGRRLLWRAADWARARERGQLGMETQNINVGACKFYAKQACQLGAIHRFGYAGCPDGAGEVMFLWYLDL